ncbi:MAG: hypothetical protein D6759_20155 [Chloroflexi bacterium]|nr:MAG: hypothetical protein D6759_20155 [Chloroflexota bacterium]
MPKLVFTQETLPESGEALAQLLQETLARASPLDDFVEVVKTLAHFEQQYGMDSPTFFARFERGEMGDRPDFFRWAGQYQICCEIQQSLSAKDYAR